MKANYPGRCACGTFVNPGDEIELEGKEIIACPTCEMYVGPKGLGFNEDLVMEVEVIKVRFTSSDSNFAIAQVKLAGGVLPEGSPVHPDGFSLKGNLGSTAKGALYEVQGRWENAKRWGWGFRAESAVPIIRADERMITSLLRPQFDLTARQVKMLTEAMGGPEAVLEDIELREGEGVLKHLPSGRKGLDDMMEVQAKLSSMKAKAAFFREFRGQVRDIILEAAFDAWQDKAMEVLRADPYYLCEVGPWADADRLGGIEGLAFDDPRRLGAGFVRALLDVSEDFQSGGHVVSRLEHIQPFWRKLGLPGSALSGVKPASRPLYTEEGDELHGARAQIRPGPLYGLTASVQSDESFARLLQEWPYADPLQLPVGGETDPSIWGGMTPHANQAEAVRAFAKYPVLAITGGPGVGKSACTKALVNVARENRVSIVGVAPTGKAARRLHEASGIDTSTIHSFLNIDPELGFRPTIVIMDEASMTDSWLMDSFLKQAHSLGTKRVVLVGDVDQLPPVGTGAPFRDILALEWVPTVRLTHIFRQAEDSGIPFLARAINEGAPEMPFRQDCPFMVPTAAAPSSGEETVGELFSLGAQHMIVQVATEVLPRLVDGDIQVVAPKFSGTCGTFALNQALKEVINPGQGTTPLRSRDRCQYMADPGDRVVQKKNDRERGIVNGEQGYVLLARRDPKKDVFANVTRPIKGIDLGDLPWPQDPYIDDSMVDLPGVTTDMMSSVVMVVAFPDPGGSYRLVPYQKKECAYVELAYCTTVHAAQGQTYDAVVVACMPESAFMLSRALLYTAITRGSKYAVMIGDYGCMLKGTQNRQDDFRRTIALPTGRKNG